MKQVGPIEFVVIETDSNEQQKLLDFITMQEKSGGLNSIGALNESKRICNITWKSLKKIVMEGDYKNTKQLRFPLQEHEKILLQRYIDAER